MGRFVYETAVANGSAIAIDGFFGESNVGKSRYDK